MALKPKNMTRISQAVASILNNDYDCAIISSYELFNIILNIYKTGDKLYLREDFLSPSKFRSIRSDLIKNDIIRKHTNYLNNIYRISSYGEITAQEVICNADKSSYISHISAMQHYSFTDRRPEGLFFTTLDANTKRANLLKNLLEALSQQATPDDIIKNYKFIINISKHPKKIKNTPIHILETKSIGRHITLRNTQAQISSVGQTFCDMLSRPDICGWHVSHLRGMARTCQTISFRYSFYYR